MSLPKAWIRDPDIIEKAEAMCARHSDAGISDYLGMDVRQVGSVRRSRSPGDDRMRPRAESDAALCHSEEQHWRNDAVVGSARLAERINALFRRAQ